MVQKRWSQLYVAKSACIVNCWLFKAGVAWTCGCMFCHTHWRSCHVCVVEIGIRPFCSSMWILFFFWNFCCSIKFSLWRQSYWSVNELNDVWDSHFIDPSKILGFLYNRKLKNQLTSSRLAAYCLSRLLITIRRLEYDVCFQIFNDVHAYVWFQAFSHFFPKKVLIV